MTIEIGYLENSGAVNHARSFRRAYLSLAGGAGVATAAELDVTQRAAGANLSVDVAAGFAFVAGTEGTRPGLYAFHSDATVNVTVTAGDATNPRIDRIIARVKDTEYGDASDAGSLEVVTGTPSNDPLLPALPANALELAQINVPAGMSSVTNSIIAEKRTFHNEARKPRGWLNSATTITHGPGIGNSNVALTDTNLTLTTEAGRNYELRIQVTGHTDVANGRLAFDLFRDGTQIAGSFTLGLPSTGNTDATANWQYVDVAPSAGSHTYQWQVRANSGASGTLNAGGKASVYDVGALVNVP